MPQGIRRTTLQQARTEDPFEALLKVDANRVDRRFKSGESELAREFKQGMFDEEMILNRDKFAETQMQNAASRANAAARLGLARSAAGRASKAPSWYEKQRQLHLWGLEDINAQGAYKNKNEKGSSFSSGIPSQLTAPGGVDEDVLMNLYEQDAALYNAGFGKAERQGLISKSMEEVSSLNPFNYNTYAPKKDFF